MKKIERDDAADWKNKVSKSRKLIVSLDYYYCRRRRAINAARRTGQIACDVRVGPEPSRRPLYDARDQW